MVCANINIRLDLKINTNSFTQVTAHKNVALLLGAAFEWVTLCGQSVSLARPMVTVSDLTVW